jgi:hypothetical protein
MTTKIPVVPEPKPQPVPPDKGPKPPVEMPPDASGRQQDPTAPPEGDPPAPHTPRLMARA